MKSSVICAAVLLVVLQLASAEVKYVAVNIVETMAVCPVKSQRWDRKVFDVNNILDMTAVLEEQGVSKVCQDSAQTDLIECVQDGPNVDDPMTGSSLDVMSGCCSKKCADGIKKAKASGCLAEYVKAVCAKQATVDKFGAGLLNLGTRCADYASTCPGMKLPPGVAPPKTATATVATVKTGTVNGTAAAAAATEKAAEPTASPAPAAAPTPSPSPAPKSNAVAVATSFAAAVMAAGAAVLAL